MAPSSFAVSPPTHEFLKSQTPASTTTVPPIGVRPGRLVIVGSGIKGIGQFTLEAVSEIKYADKVFFGVADPATEAFILENNPKAVDLYSLYDDGKHRSDTYVQMAEVLLREVRKGYYVVGVFYGHPGVFVNPSHRAIAIARHEGYSAVMYAGVSAEDCLFAEIGVDPSRPGCQTIEATDLLLRNRPLLTDSHVIIFQVGCVGLMDFDFKGFKNIHFPVLVERLIKDYGEEHTVVSFQDSQVRFVPSAVKHFLIKDLWNPEVQKMVSGLTTFYLPPKDLRPTDPIMSERLGLQVPPANLKPFYGPFPVNMPYTKRALAAVEALDAHQLPVNYRKLRATPHMYDALRRLALDPQARLLYAKNKSSLIAPHLDLRPVERRALLSDKAYIVNMSMKAEPATVADEFVYRLLRDPTFSKQWSTELKTCPKEPPEAFALHIQNWLFSKGFDITTDDVKAAWAREKLNPGNLKPFSAVYNTQVDGKDGPTLTIRANTVSWGKAVIQDFSFESSKLSWSQSKNNVNGAELNLTMLSDDYPRLLSKESYIGPSFSGTIEVDGATSKVIGRVGDFPPEPDSHPTTGTKVSQYNSTYSTYIKNVQGKWEESNDKLVVDDPTVAYQGKVLRNFAWAKNSLFTVLTKDGNAWNISIHFYTVPESTENRVSGLHFYGRRWATGESPPDPNFMGVIGHLPDPKKESDWAVLRLQSIMSAMNIVNSNIGALVFDGTFKLVEKISAWRSNSTPEAQKEVEEARKGLDDAIRAEEDIELLDITDNLEDNIVGSDTELFQYFPEPQIAEEEIVTTDELAPFVDVDIVFVGVEI